MATYFILNKKDRSGKIQSRPFQAVLDSMKKQETEEAKLKQSSSLKGGNIQNLPPSLPPPPPEAPRENGHVQHPAPAPIPAPAPMPAHAPAYAPMPQYDPNLIRHEPPPVKMVRNEDYPSNYLQHPAMRNRAYEEQMQMRGPDMMMNDQYDPSKSYNAHLQRSRACAIL